MAERTLRGDEVTEAAKLARVISNALDDALIVTGLIPATECRPFDALTPVEQDAIKLAAVTVYKQLVWHPVHEYVAVIPHHEGG